MLGCTVNRYTSCNHWCHQINQDWNLKDYNFKVSVCFKRRACLIVKQRLKLPPQHLSDVGTGGLHPKMSVTFWNFLCVQTSATLQMPLRETDWKCVPSSTSLRVIGFVHCLTFWTAVHTFAFRRVQTSLWLRLCICQCRSSVLHFWRFFGLCKGVFSTPPQKHPLETKLF